LKASTFFENFIKDYESYEEFKEYADIFVDDVTTLKVGFNICG